MTLTIGVAARNEEATIAQALHSIEVALAALAVPAELIVAVNGCTDRTADIARAYAAAHRGDVAFRLVESEPGQIEAQRTIARLACSTGPLILVDADCVLDPGCLQALVHALAEHPQAQAAWATMVPADHDRPRAFWRSVYNFADYYPDVVHRGRHLCGRAFAIRRYDVPATSGAAPVQPVNRRVADYLSLDRGPLVDDSFLSRALVKRYGTEAIHHAEAARVYFQPIPRLRDFYSAQRRKAYEPRRLDLLFPEYRSVRRRHFRRRIDRSAYARLPPVARLQCRLYLNLYAGLRRLARLQLALGVTLVRVGVPLRPCDIWPAVAGTKTPFTAGMAAPPLEPR